VKVSVVDGQNRRLKGVRVRVTGAGVRATTKATNALGQASFKLTPKKRGKLVFSATLVGYQPAYGTVTVR
jgi:hypothetical protein